MIYICATLISVFFAFLMYHTNENSFAITGIPQNKYIKQNFCVIRRNHKYSYFLMLCCWMPLFLVSGLRWNVGTDFGPIYVKGFQKISEGGTFPWEMGYIFLNKAVSTITKDPAGIFILTSFIFLTFVFKAMYDLSVDIRLSVLLLVSTGFYFQSMNIIRQSITSAMFLYSLKFIRDKKFVPFLTVILLASTIHLSALIFIPVYFFCQLRIPPRKGILLLLISIICLPFVRPVFVFLVSLTKYKWYLNSSYNKFDFAITDTIVGVILVVLGYYYYKNSNNDKTYSILMNLQLLALIISLYSSVIFLADRIIPCFTASQLLFVPLIISQEKDKKTRTILTCSLMTFFVLTCCYTYGVLGWSDILPYHSIFSR
jgi:transmembrane protein EpsG